MDAKELESAIAKGIFKGLLGVLLILFVGWISSPIWMPLGLIAGEYLLRNWEKINWNSVLLIFWWYGVSFGILYLLDIGEVRKLNEWNLGSNPSGLREFALLFAIILHTVYGFFLKEISLNPFVALAGIGLLVYVAFREKKWFGRW
jgi:hypothetical protein